MKLLLDFEASYLDHHAGVLPLSLIRASTLRLEYFRFLS